MRSCSLLALGVLVVAQALCSSSAQAWDFPRGPASGTGANLSEEVITAANVGSLKRVWARGMSGGYSGGVTADAGRVFYGTGYGYLDRNPYLVVARRAATGRLLWSTKLSRPTTSTPVVHDGDVFVFAGADRIHASGRLYALSVRSGRVLWSYGVSGSGYDVPTWPLVHNGLVYMFWHDSDGTMTALDESSGRLVWRIRHQQFNGQLTFANGYLFNGGRVYAPKTGRFLGTFPEPAQGGSAPILGSDGAYEVGTGEAADGQPHIFVRKYSLTCVPRSTPWCPPVWKRVFDGTTQGAFAVTPHRLLIPVEFNTSTGAGGVLAVGTAAGHPQWKWTAPAGTVGRDVSVGGDVAYLTTWRYSYYQHPRLYAFAAAGCTHPSCSSLGSWATGRQGISFEAAPVIDHGTVFIWNDWQDGVWAFAPASS
jgi:outer membrane protein assembly factor BamB